MTAVGAVVVAGLTPGILAASPTGLPFQGPNAGITAADVVAIDGSAFSFDELYAMQHAGNVWMHREAYRIPPQHATRYGGPTTAIKPQVLLQGGSRPQKPTIDFIEMEAEKIHMAILEYLMDYCAELIDADARGIPISPDDDLTSKLGMTEDELKALKAEIEEYFGVEVSYHRFYLIGQLNTLRLVTDYIIRIKTVWNR